MMSNKFDIINGIDLRYRFAIARAVYIYHDTRDGQMGSIDFPTECEDIRLYLPMPSSTIGLGPAFAFRFVEALVLAHAPARLSFVFVYVRTTSTFQLTIPEPL